MNNFIILGEFNYGCGNILFQYFYAKLLSEKFNIKFFHQYIPILKIESNMHLLEKNKYKTKDITNFIDKLEKKINYKIYFFGSLENYIFWQSNLDFVRLSYNNLLEKNSKDLVIHLRAGNDWVNSNNYSMPSAASYKNLLENIKFEKLYIVTNCTKYDQWSMNDLYELQKKLKTNGGDGENKNKYNVKSYPWVINDEILNKINEIIKLFNSFNPIWVSDTLEKDFDFMCRFDKIILAPSTFSWWAGVLSKSKEIYVYKNWKNLGYIKVNGLHKCKNLGETNYEGWKQWV